MPSLFLCCLPFWTAQEETALYRNATLLLFIIIIIIIPTEIVMGAVSSHSFESANLEITAYDFWKFLLPQLGNQLINMHTKWSLDFPFHVRKDNGYVFIEYKAQINMNLLGTLLSQQDWISSGYLRVTAANTAASLYHYRTHLVICFPITKAISDWSLSPYITLWQTLSFAFHHFLHGQKYLV